jgi:hypothetical protein
MRYNLVINFRCTECGGKLQVSYDQPKIFPYQPDASDGITGAAKVEKSISVYPCQDCFHKANAPLQALRQILKEQP